MKKRNVGFTRNFMKMIGTTLAASLLFSVNVHADELDNLPDSGDIDAISEKIDDLDDKVDNLSENCSDDGVAGDISNISEEINDLDDQLDEFAKNYASLLLSINKNKADIIKGLNSNVYALDNISEYASYKDVISRINDIKYQGTLNLALDSSDKYILERGYYDGGTIDVSALIEAARKEGYEAGKQDGDKAGYERGLEAGDKAGYDRGVKAGDAAGYARGHKEVAGITPYYTTSKSATYVIPENGTYHIYASAAARFEDNHRDTVRARVTVGGAVRINAEQTKSHGKALYASGTWSGYLTKGTVVSMASSTEGWGVDLEGQMFSIVYGGR